MIEVHGWDGVGLLLALMCFMIVAGFRVAYVLLAVGFAGTTFLLQPAQPMSVGREIWEATKSYSLTAVPLFVLMAELLMRCEVIPTAYRTIARLLGRISGGAAFANIGASAVFAAVSGSSVANAAALGTAAGPAMVNLGFGRRLTFGSIAAGGTLGILMPPSTALIIYGGLSGVSVGKLFMAGIVPALLLAGLFAAVILIWSLVRRQDAPRGAPEGAEGLRTGLTALLPIIVLIGLVLGGIYGGIFTPTEAGGIGVVGACLIMVQRRRFSPFAVWQAAEATVALTSMILLIVAGAATITYVAGMTSLPSALTNLVRDLDISLTTTLLIIAVGYVVLGFFIESVSLIVLTVPVIFPVMQSLGVDGVWLGIYVVVLIEIGLITPPIGLNLFVLQRIPAGQSMTDIMIGSVPFLIALFLMVALLILFPSIATWLPYR